jgi:hypothetical protein
MTARAPDDCQTSEAARLLGLPLHRVQQIVRQGHVAQPTKGRIGLIAAACGHVAALREDARRLPSTSARRTAAKRDDSARRAILKAEDDALFRLDRLARRADPSRRAAIRAAQARIRAARAEAMKATRDV